MLKPLLGILFVISCNTSVLADYVAQRKAAVELVRAGKQEEAAIVFNNMAATATSDLQRSDALEQAVLCLLSLKKHDQAMEVARRIPLAPVSKTCQMRVLAATRKWQELVDTFGKEEIHTWPEGIDADAFFLRGQAYYAVKDGVKAEADLKKAAEYLTEDNSKGLALNALGNTYQHLLKDEARAIEAYRRVYQTRNVAKQSQAAISIASILRRQNRLDDAIQELQRIALDQLTVDYWRGAMLHAQGVTLAAQGKKAEAMSSFKEALQTSGNLPRPAKRVRAGTQEASGTRPVAPGPARARSEISWAISCRQRRLSRQRRQLSSAPQGHLCLPCGLPRDVVRRQGVGRTNDCCASLPLPICPTYF